MDRPNPESTHLTDSARSTTPTPDVATMGQSSPADAARASFEPASEPAREEVTRAGNDETPPQVSLTPSQSSSNASHPGEASSDLVALRPITDDQPTVLSHLAPSLGLDFQLAAGQKLGPYEILAAVGTGGMASVLRAKDTDLGRIVALKILPPATAKDAEAVVRFKQEARAAAKLDHDNIARVFACGEDQGLHYIAFEYVEGENLRNLIEQRGPLPLIEAIQILIQVCQGLTHAHERGVVHRDIKPSNLVITPDGKAKIVDMGLARTLQPTINGGVTQSGVTLGTFDYISPEQALDPRRADVRSDLYSLGCTIYHALTGKAPVPEGTAARKLYAHQHEPVLDPRVLRPDLPDGFAVILSKLMAKEPSRRYPTPDALIPELQLLLACLQPSKGSSVTAGASPGPVNSVRSARTAFGPAAPWPRGAVGLLALGGLLLLGSLILLGFGGSSTSQNATMPEWLTPSYSKATNSPNATSWLPLPETPMTANTPTATPDRETNPPSASPSPNAINGDTRLEGIARPKNSDELHTALRDPRTTTIQLEPGQRYLVQRGSTGVWIPARKLLRIESTRPNEPLLPILRVAITTPGMDEQGQLREAGCTFDRIENLEFLGVAFEFVGTATIVDYGTRPIGWECRNCRRVRWEQCRFDSVEGELSNSDGIGWFLRNTTTEVCQVRGKHLYAGLRRGTAFQLAGFILAEFEECAFPPHTACFGLVPPSLTGSPATPMPPNSENVPPSQLKLSHCSFLVDQGSIVEVEGQPRWQVNAGWCVFASGPPDPTMMMMMTPPEMPARRPAMVRILGDKAEGFRFRGELSQRNVYFRLDPLVLGNRLLPVPLGATSSNPGSNSPTTLPSPMATLATNPGSNPGAVSSTAATTATLGTEVYQDRDAVELRVSPWAADPFPLLLGARPWEAFRLKSTLPGVRVPRADVLLVGFREPRAGARLYDPWPPPAQEKPTDPRVKTIHPAATAAELAVNRNLFRSLEEALIDAKPDDIFQIQADGPVELSAVLIRQPRLRLTLRPAPGFKPVLTLSPTAPAEGSLFLLQDGELTLENLDFRLQGRSAATQGSSQSIVTVSGGRACRFLGCTITFEERPDDPCRMVWLNRLTRPGPEPKITVQQTFLRGRGRALTSLDRAYDLEWLQSISAVTGPFLEWAASPQTEAERLNPTESLAPLAVSHWRFERWTALTNGPLWQITNPQSVNRMPPIEVTTNRCLFVGPDGGQFALFRDTEGNEPTRWIRWATLGENWIHGFQDAWFTLLPQNALMSRRYRATDWQDLLTADSRVPTTLQATLPKPLSNSRDWVSLEPATFETIQWSPPPVDPRACGAWWTRP